MSLFSLFLLFFTCVLLPAHAFETYESFDIETFQDIEVKRVPEALYLTLTINSPSTARSDFSFMALYYSEQLSGYFDGNNYDGRPVPRTTPMFIKLDVLDMSAPRSASFLIPKELTTNPPAPKFPLHLQPVEEKYYFIKKINETDLGSILHAASRLLVDLSYARMPFEDTVVHLALYDYPPNSENRETEIWVERSLKNEGYVMV